MNILITNDDGVQAAGLIELARVLKDKHNLTIVAPDSERSGMSHALTLHRPLTVNETYRDGLEGVRMYSVNGTPVDCVHVGLDALTDGMVDLLIAGINNGANLGGDVAYSGTVHAALEGCAYGTPSIALSQRMRPGLKPEEKQTAFVHAAAYSAQIIDQLALRALDQIMYNVNFPTVSSEDSERIPEIKVCAQGVSPYSTEFRKQDDPFGRTYYWIYATDNANDYNEVHKTDVYWSNLGYATVTPMRWNLTATDRMSTTADFFDNISLHGLGEVAD